MDTMHLFTTYEKLKLQTALTDKINLLHMEKDLETDEAVKRSIEKDIEEYRRIKSKITIP